MVGKTLKEIGFTEEVQPKHVAVKEAVLPFDKFAGADTLLGPEMRSTGEVMGIDAAFPMAYAKAQIAAGQRFVLSGNVFLSVNDISKPEVVPLAKMFTDIGFTISSTGGTAKVLKDAGVKVNTVLKMHEGRPHVGDLLQQGGIQLMIITSTQNDARDAVDGRNLRRLSLAKKVPLVTTMAGARATVMAIKALKEGEVDMICLQDFFPEGGVSMLPAGQEDFVV
eukprot:1182932-Prorocentrum_minimum.AAC.4